MPEKQVIKKEWVETNALPGVIRNLQPDVAIIPLSDVQHFNQYKSPMKFLEYAAMKIPMVVKDTLPYNELAINGETCLTYTNDEEFKKVIKHLKDDKILRGKLVGNAYKLTQKFSLQDKAKDVIKLYKDFTETYKVKTKK